MILLRQKLYSRKLGDSRIGIGWTQDGNGKVDAEKYFRVGKEAADKAAEEGKSDEEIIKAAKKAAGKKATLDNIGKPAWKTIRNGGLAAAGAYLIARNPGYIENQIRRVGIDSIKLPKEFMRKHAEKIALGSGLIGAGTILAKEGPRIAKKRKAARLGAEINTKERLKKSK